MDPAGILDLLRICRPDVAALQEVPRYLPAYRMIDLPRRLSGLGRRVTYRSSVGVGPIGFGNALLTRMAPSRVMRFRLPGHGEPRSLLTCRMPLGAHDLLIATTHLGLDARSRALQARAIVERLQTVRCPVLLAGDFNTERAASELAALADAGFRPASPEGPATFPSPAPSVGLDQLWLRGLWRVRDVRAVSTLASDHLPLMAELELA